MWFANTLARSRLQHQAITLKPLDLRPNRVIRDAEVGGKFSHRVTTRAQQDENLSLGCAEELLLRLRFSTVFSSHPPHCSLNRYAMPNATNKAKYHVD